MAVRRVRRSIAAGVAICALLALGACSSRGSQAESGVANPSAASSAAPAGTAPVTVAPLPSDDTSAGLGPDSSGATDAAPSTTAASATTPVTTQPPAAPPATVVASPALGSTGIAPGEPVTVTATGGTLTSVTFTKAGGEAVAGTVSEDGTTWTLGAKLGFGKAYTVAGEAVNADGVATSFTGTYTTAKTIEPVNVSISPGDGAVVGVAAPIIVSLGYKPSDLALIERNVKVVTTPKVEGSWAWIQHAGYTYPSLDWRPKTYWPAGTKVHVEANLYGLKFADNWYGGDDVAVDFTIGRNQVVKADATKNLVQVFRDGKLWAKYDGSFGKGAKVGDDNLVTRSGIHVVTSKSEVYHMSNPEYGYTDAKEYWAVRISNNGEFLHNNPGTSPWSLANANVTHGCINLSWDDAKAYFESAMYGDPVEVTGTSVQLSKADGDIYDWTYSWAQWQQLSALAPNSTVVS